jgi:hypothetical protein
LPCSDILFCFILGFSNFVLARGRYTISCMTRAGGWCCSAGYFVWFDEACGVLTGNIDMVSKGGVMISGPTHYLLWATVYLGPFEYLRISDIFSLLSLVVYGRSDVLGASFW